MILATARREIEIMITDQHQTMRDSQLPLIERIDAALKRISEGHSQMRIPAEATDPDLVLADCKEALAAKDRELAELRQSLQSIADTSLAVHDRVRAYAAGKATSLPVGVDSLPHLDSARLDKLPQCFHMLRRFPGANDPRQPEWWLTYAPNNVYNSVRAAIDAHQETKP